MIVAPVLTTERFLLRALTVQDVSARYLSWLGDPSASHIIASRTTHAMADLMAYVAEKTDQEDVVFLGIFDLLSGLHVGNIKFEPVDLDQAYTVLGLLIGDGDYRGRGVAVEVITACAAWLASLGVREILLGVANDNTAALRAYEKAGFRIAETAHLPAIAGRYTMALAL